jgi:hypothetical protein
VVLGCKDSDPGRQVWKWDGHSPFEMNGDVPHVLRKYGEGNPTRIALDGGMDRPWVTGFRRRVREEGKPTWPASRLMIVRWLFARTDRMSNRLQTARPGQSDQHVTIGATATRKKGDGHKEEQESCQPREREIRKFRRLLHVNPLVCLQTNVRYQFDKLFLAASSASWELQTL